MTTTTAVQERTHTCADALERLGSALDALYDAIGDSAPSTDQDWQRDALLREIGRLGGCDPRGRRWCRAWGA